MKKVLGIIAAICLLMTVMAGWTLAEEAQGVVVRNHAELLAAVNEQKADLIIISAKYKHKSTSTDNLVIEAGRSVTVRPEKEGTYTLKDRLDILGEGEILFDRVNIEAPAGSAGLWIGESVHVTIDSVTAGKGKGANGCTAVFMEGGNLTIGSAVATDGTTGLGGDGIYAYSGATMRVKDARGGTAKKGVGGAGVVLFDGATAVITGEARGGDGLYGEGQGVLVGLNSAADIQGTAADGALIPSKKPVDPEEITSRSLLENAIRRGRTEIQISQKFKGDDTLDSSHVQFTASEAPVVIRKDPAAEKNPSLGFRWSVVAGTWTVKDVDNQVNARSRESLLSVQGSAALSWTGNITGKGAASCVSVGERGELTFTGDLKSDLFCVYASGDSKVTINGNLTANGKEWYAAGTEDNAALTVNGSVTAAKDSNAVYIPGGTLEVSGLVSSEKNDGYPTVYVSGGEGILRGGIRSAGKAGQAIYCKGGNLTVEGDVDSASTKRVPVSLKKGAGTVTIHGDLIARREAARAEGGLLTIDGDLIIRSKDSWGLYSTDGEGQIILTGTDRREDP